MPRSLSSSNLEGYFQKIINNEKRRQMKSGISSQISNNEAIRVGIKRIPGLSETNAKASALELKPLHHYVFCTHEVPYWRTCAKCGRTKELAERNANMILRSTHKLAL